jgi:hypothetical protein
MHDTMTVSSYKTKTTTAPGWQFVYLYAALLLGAMVAINFAVPNVTYFQRLADSFVQGRLDVPTPTPDIAHFNGRYYYPDGPLPILAMIPFSALGVTAPLGIIAITVNLAVFYLCFLLARRFDYSPIDACWLAVAFCFGTSFIGVIHVPWGLSTTLTVLCQFAAIMEYEAKRRYPLIGLYVALAMMGHAPAGLMILMFGFLALRDGLNKAIGLGVPFAIAVAILALYNFARFGDPLESGYNYQMGGIGTTFQQFDTPGNIAGPALRLAYIPTNLKVFLFGLPERIGIGTSIFIMSPFAVYLLTLRRWDMTNTLIMLNVLLVTTAILSFRSTGFQQVGYRFSLDFLPFIFWLAVRSRLEITRGLQAMILAATLVDIALVGYLISTKV